jgi:hypothetical protein
VNSNMHRVEPMPAASNHPSGVIQNVFDLASYAVQVRLAEAWAQGGPGYAIHRHLHFSARRDLQAVFDDLAVNLGWRAQRFDAVSLLLEADGLLVSASGTRKPDYCSRAFDIWGQSVQPCRCCGRGNSGTNRRWTYPRSDDLGRLAVPEW